MLSPTGQVFSTLVATGRRWQRGEAASGVFEGCGSPAGECAGGELLVASRPWAATGSRVTPKGV